MTTGEGFILCYFILGVVLFAAYTHVGIAAKASYVVFFPGHWCVLSFVRLCLTHTGSWETHPLWNIVVSIGVLWLLWLLCSS